MIFALKKWRHYLHGGPRFKIITDHLALKWLMSLKDPRGRLARWMVEVQGYDFEVSHAPGSCLSVPDCLSRDSNGSHSSMNDASETVSPIREPDVLPTEAEFLDSQREEFGDLNEFIECTADHFVDEDGFL